MNKVVKEKIKEAITLFVIVLTFMSALVIMFKYENEGERNMPFRLAEMLVISSAEGYGKEENPNNNHWNININQYNDIYLKIQKNDDISDMTYLDSISISNIQIIAPEGKKVFAYMPSNEEDKLFSYEDSFKIENILTFKGAEIDNSKKLEIGNQGGTVVFRIVNKDVSEYISNDDGELSYDGTLLKNTGVSEESIKINVSFDLIITTNNTSYKGRINIDLPIGNILEEGIAKLHQTDFSDVVFKRQK